MQSQLNLKQAPVELVTITTKNPPTQIHNRLQTGTTNQLTIDKGSLEKELHDAVKGEVRFGSADRGMYASDASNYRMVPLGVILPTNADDVVAAVAVLYADLRHAEHTFQFMSKGPAPNARI